MNWCVNIVGNVIFFFGTKFKWSDVTSRTCSLSLYYKKIWSSLCMNKTCTYLVQVKFKSLIAKTNQITLRFKPNTYLSYPKFNLKVQQEFISKTETIVCQKPSTDYLFFIVGSFSVFHQSFTNNDDARCTTTIVKSNRHL